MPKSPKPDKPVSFGYKCAWYAMHTKDADAVVSALDLQGVVASGWSEGIQMAYEDKVFVTPPLGDWILAVGWPLVYEGQVPADTVEPILADLSDLFGEAQYFATHRVVEAHCWALSQNGNLVRGFGYVGDQGEINWNEGKPTKAELALGKGILEFPGPDESHVMKIAGAWSVDPSALESKFSEPGLGRLGSWSLYA